MGLPYNADVAAVAPRESSGERMTEVMENRKVRIVLVDDHAVVRAGFKQLIETTDDLEVAGEAGTAADALAFVASQPCDVMLLDISLPDASVLDTVAALRRHALLHDEGRGAHGGWAEWLRTAGGTAPHRGGEIVFTDSHLMLQAAAEGQGVALARSVLAAGDLLGGRLVRPFEWSIPARYHYFLVYPAAHEARAEVRAFREFLLAEVTRRLPQARRPRKPIRSKGSSTARAAP